MYTTQIDFWRLVSTQIHQESIAVCQQFKLRKHAVCHNIINSKDVDEKN